MAGRTSRARMGDDVLATIAKRDELAGQAPSAVRRAGGRPIPRRRKRLTWYYEGLKKQPRPPLPYELTISSFTVCGYH